MDIDKIGHGKKVKIISPDMFRDGKPGQNPVFIVEQELQDWIFLTGEDYRFPLAKYFMGTGIDFQISYPKYGWFYIGWAPE